MKVITVELPEWTTDLYEKKLTESEFETVPEYVQHLLKIIASEIKKEEENVDLSDDEKIAERLKDLGYI